MLVRRQGRQVTRQQQKHTHTHALSIVGNDQVLDLVTLRFDRYILAVVV